LSFHLTSLIPEIDYHTFRVFVFFRISGRVSTFQQEGGAAPRSCGHPWSQHGRVEKKFGRKDVYVVAQGVQVCKKTPYFQVENLKFEYGE
jgi:hypothetical protein